jgi:dipeptidyl aminopeptidase/acylaminoacyl peptidase
MALSDEKRSISRRSFTVAASLGLAEAVAGFTGLRAPNAQAQEVPRKSPENDHLWVRPVEGSEVENLPDGSTGRISEFRACEGTFLPAYMRRPQGPGPFPVVVIQHGGSPSAKGTYNMARTRPPSAAFIEQGWAVLWTDFRETRVPLRFPGGAVSMPAHPAIEWHDALAAIEAVRNLSYIDGRRIAIMGASHGGNVHSHVVSRADIQGSILCSPAIFDLIELAKALDQNVPMIQPIKNKIAEGEQHYGAKMSVVAEHPECYGYESPMMEVSKVRCPILILNGLNDTSSPPSVMQVYAEKLRAAGKTVETYMPENAPHEFYFGAGHPPRPAESAEATRRAVAFVRKCFA